MDSNLPPEFLANIASAAACPRRDTPTYLADCVVRFLLEHSEHVPHGPWFIRAGIGTLSRDSLDGPLVFTSAALIPSTPSLGERASLLAAALRRWTDQGLPVVTGAELDRRREACESCPHRARPSLANGWLGACRLCGCTGAKLFLATERCPATPGRW